jgi:hypothetical protein
MDIKQYKRTLTMLWFLMIAVGLTLALTACGGGSLQGKWSLTEINVIWSDESMRSMSEAQRAAYERDYRAAVEQLNVEVEFFSDGTGTSVVRGGRHSSSTTFNWSEADGRLNISGNWRERDDSMAIEIVVGYIRNGYYRVRGSRLNISHPIDGSSHGYEIKFNRVR